MCGIVGIVARSPVNQLLYDGLLLLQHRGQNPAGIVLGHNGNLTNSDVLKEEMFRMDLRHINTGSDSEVLVNVLAHELESASVKLRLEPQAIFTAVANVHRRLKGAYAVIAMIAGYGVLAFRDPFGIRPLVIGYNETATGTQDIGGSQSGAVGALGDKGLRHVVPRAGV